MPNKDSFTFSDKLRKSKSVPLSKRLPSIVGGKNTQKRTLVQRAQRDLPFILVAALALLLLPFLSRNGSDDIASTGDITWGQMADSPSFAEGGGSDIMPADAMRDPMDLILRPRSAVEAVSTPASPSKSAYDSSSSGRRSGSSDWDSDRYSRSSRTTTGSGVGRASGTPSASSSGADNSRGYTSTRTTRTSTKKPAAAGANYQTRDQYDKTVKKKTTTPTTTEQFAKTTKPSVRKSFERKGTDINRALRISGMSGGKGGGGMSYSLPIGQGPSRGGSGSPREGVRPVALQPMEARGNVGRNTTGENLYAEASRSIGAMNAGGPAKANLLAAQMRDVDGGKPGESAGFGSGGGAAGPRPGAGGGGPGNTNGYNVAKPWWWDMMETRNQKLWDLYYYKPREMFWNNLYNVGLGIFNCLLTGDKGGDVSNFFGKGGDSNNLKCITKEIPSFKDFVQLAPGHKTTDKDGNKTEEYDNDMARLWFSLCPNQADGTPGYEIKKSSDKNFFQVRAACLGLDVVTDWLKAITKHTKYGSNCVGVNSDPMKFSLKIERSNARGKHNKNREATLKSKTVIALLAKVKRGPYAGRELVVYAEQGNKLSGKGSDFAASFNAEHKDYCYLSHLVAFVSKKSSGQVSRRIKKYNADETPAHEELVEQNERDSDPRFEYVDVPSEGQISAARNICLTGNSDVKPITIDDIRDRSVLGKDKGDSYQECKIWEKKPSGGDMRISNEPCAQYPERPVEIKERNEFTYTVANSEDKHVFAIVVEEVSGETTGKVIYIVDFNDDSAKMGGKVCPNDSSTCLYRFNLNAATMGWNPDAYGKEKPRKISGYTQSSTKKSTGNAGDAGNTDNATEETQTSSSSPNDGTYRGAGKVFWIITEDPVELKVEEGSILNDLGRVDTWDLITPSQAVYRNICSYRWCDGLGSCDNPNNQPIAEEMCEEDNKAYVAIKVPVNVEKDGKTEIENHYIKQGNHEIPWNLGEYGLPDCEKLCKGADGKLHKCDNDGTPEENVFGICSDDSVTHLIPPCPVCCQYDRQNYKSIEVDEKYYIIDADPEKCKDKNYEGLCEVAAWSNENNNFRVYNMVENYNPDHLPLIPDNSFTTAQYAGDKPIPLGNVLINLTEEFRPIKDQAEKWDPKKPREFKLFPKLELLNPAKLPDLSVCNILVRNDYENAHIEVSQDNQNVIADKIANCFANIKIWEAAGYNMDDFKTLNFYGYASKASKYCAKGHEHCNKALSEDRIFYLLDRIPQNSQLRTYKIGLRQVNNYRAEDGFTNTEPNDELQEDESYRYKYSFAFDSEREFNFVSQPCGESGASNNHDKERYVLITPFWHDQSCTQRVTLDNANKDLEDWIQMTIPANAPTMGTGSIVSNSIPEGPKGISPEEIVDPSLPMA